MYWDIKKQFKVRDILALFRERGAGIRETSSNIHRLLDQRETLITPWGTKVTPCGGGWYHIGGYSFDGSDVQRTIDALG